MNLEVNQTIRVSFQKMGKTWKIFINFLLSTYLVKICCQVITWMRNFEYVKYIKFVSVCSKLMKLMMGVKSFIKLAKETRKIQNVSFYSLHLLCSIADITLGIMVCEILIDLTNNGWKIKTLFNLVIKIFQILTIESFEL